jgi:prolyl-tRNA synthetase
MGCYGIGIGRLMGSIMEEHRDKFGPRWPMSVAPWQVHINALNLSATTVRDTSEKVYTDLLNAGVEVLFDDRDVRPGAQFADADLIGVPIRFIVSERNLATGSIEWKRRDTGESGTISVDAAVTQAKAWIRETLDQLSERR